VLILFIKNLLCVTEKRKIDLFATVNANHTL
jgi:hypothetical protein